MNEAEWVEWGGGRKSFSMWVTIFVVLRLPICLSNDNIKAICLKNTIISSQRETSTVRSTEDNRAHAIEF